VEVRPVVGVVGGSGGVGASTFAAAIALGASQVVRGPAVLIDLDPVGGGIDALLGMHSSPGFRWSDLSRPASPRLIALAKHLRSKAWRSLTGPLAALPRWESVAVLSIDTPSLPPPKVTSLVVDRARAGSPVVFDLSRCPSRTRTVALAQCRLVLLVAFGRGRGIAGARSVRHSLGDLPVGLVVRHGGPIGPHRASALIGAPLRGEIAFYPNLVDPIAPGSVPPAMTELAGQLVRDLKP
jgi:hypothetical protein